MGCPLPSLTGAKGLLIRQKGHLCWSWLGGQGKAWTACCRGCRQEVAVERGGPHPATSSWVGGKELSVRGLPGGPVHAVGASPVTGVLEVGESSPCTGSPTHTLTSVSAEWCVRSTPASSLPFPVYFALLLSLVCGMKRSLNSGGKSGLFMKWHWQICLCSWKKELMCTRDRPARMNSRWVTWMGALWGEL